MKARTRFVSNSSTSSFCIVVTKDAHDKALSQLSPWEKELIKSLVGEPTSFMGKEVLTFGEVETHGYSSWDKLYVKLDPSEYDQTKYAEDIKNFGELQTVAVVEAYLDLIPGDEQLTFNFDIG